MYKVKFYKKDYFYFYLFYEKRFITKFLGFCELVNYLEINNIDFNDVKIQCSFKDLFFHIVNYDSVIQRNNFNKFQEEKRKHIHD